MKQLYPFRCEPCQVKAIWQGNKLQALRHSEDSFGSSGEIFVHRNGDNRIRNGEYAGKMLSELLATYPKEMMGENKIEDMLRITFLDAAQSLSIQVHPYDEYAAKYANDQGKVEAWYIVDADPGADLIASTLTDDIDVVKEAVKNDTLESIVKHHPMSTGDFILIEAGQLHALGPGILALEVSQNSDTTYRFYDFHRKDKNGNERPLHLKESFDVLDVKRQCEKSSYPLGTLPTNTPVTICEHEKFYVDIVDVDEEYTLPMDHKHFYCVTNVGVDMSYACGDMAEAFVCCESMFVPASSEDVTFKGKARIIISYVK